MSWKTDLFIVVIILGVLALVYLFTSVSADETTATTIPEGTTIATSTIASTIITGGATTTLQTTTQTTTETTVNETTTTIETTETTLNETTTSVTTTIAEGLFISGIELNGTTKLSEWIEISNSGESVYMADYTVRDIANHTYTFAEFNLSGTGKVRIHTGAGTDNSTDLFWGRSSAVWNNDGDTAYLYDNNKILLDQKTCNRGTCWFNE